ncbi:MULTISPECIES: DUF4363 family protein [Caproicibacterium]|jgi:hypothetical protein|nr:DUF4363 family protein [Caproicibacterium lactatifermentans]MDD4808333.1 DUF4363 family protein [Oscillospiraceae bacterium]
MKRMVVGAVLFAVSLALCSAGRRTTQTLTNDLTKTLQEADHAAQTGDTQKAYTLSKKAFEEWEKDHQILCTFQPHSRLEVIDQTLATLPDLSKCDNPGQFESECARGETLARNLQESEFPLLQNIL